MKVLGLQQLLFPPITGATDVNVQNCLCHGLTGMKELTNIDITVLNCHMIPTEVADISSWGTHGNRWQSGHMCWYKNRTSSCKSEWVTVEHTTALYCETWTCLSTELSMRTFCLLIASMGHMEEHDCSVLPALQLDYSFLLACRIWLGAHKSTKWHYLQDNQGRYHLENRQTLASVLWENLPGAVYMSCCLHMGNDDIPLLGIPRSVWVSLVCFCLFSF